MASLARTRVGSMASMAQIPGRSGSLCMPACLALSQGLGSWRHGISTHAVAPAAAAKEAASISNGGASVVAGTVTHQSSRESSSSWWRRISMAAAAAAAVGGAAAVIAGSDANWGVGGRQALCLSPSAFKPSAGSVIDSLPNYTREQVAEHSTKATRAWVIYRDGVYDVTDFIANHPGGSSKISLAAGGDLQAFWNIYQQHNNAEVHKLLEEYRIGNVAPQDRIVHKAAEVKDLYANDPKRHPALLVQSQKPFNAEVPVAIAATQAKVPNEFFFVRNHLPVPQIKEEEYQLIVTGEGAKLLRLSLDDLKTKFRKHHVESTIQCTGNRRDDFNHYKQVKGLNWEVGAISNADWAGARLTDVLKAAGVKEANGLRHVQFEGLDDDGTGLNYGASITIDKALDPKGEVILAYEMNGEPLPADHGFPVRVVAPGIVGARNVKWLGKVIVSEEESSSHWQQNDYKSFSPSVDWDTVDWSSAPAIQDSPVQSAILDPEPNAKVPVGTDVITVHGYAYSGGGRGIIRVDVSGDGGKTWITATLTKPKQEQGRVWAWTPWTATIAVDPKFEGKLEITCKATDSSYATQPERVDGIWNLRGVLNNSWHRVPVVFTEEE